MPAKKTIRKLKELEYWHNGKLYANGKAKYRYIEKRTCRDKRYKLIDKNIQEDK